MQLSALKNYNFKDGTVLIIGGRQIGGFAEDGGVEYEFPSEIYEHVSGADGQVTISQMNDFRMIATVTLMETSKSYRDLFQMLRTQEAQLLKLPLAYLHRDQINGDQVLGGQAVFLGWPAPSKSRTAGEREFQILLPQGAKSFLAGSQNIIP